MLLQGFSNELDAAYQGLVLTDSGDVLESVGGMYVAS